MLPYLWIGKYAQRSSGCIVGPNTEVYSKARPGGQCGEGWEGPEGAGASLLESQVAPGAVCKALLLDPPLRPPHLVPTWVSAIPGTQGNQTLDHCDRSRVPGGASYGLPHSPFPDPF